VEGAAQMRKKSGKVQVEEKRDRLPREWYDLIKAPLLKQIEKEQWRSRKRGAAERNKEQQSDEPVTRRCEGGECWQEVTKKVNAKMQHTR